MVSHLEASESTIDLGIDVKKERRDEEDDKVNFSFKQFVKFVGPGFLMSIAYLDPGNIESDLQSGTIARYKLLWLLLLATIVGLLMQRLAARLGVVTGKHLAEMCYDVYPKVPRVLLWMMMEIAIIGSDMQEVIGSAIAIYILSSKLIPLWGGVLITIVDTFTLLLLDNYGLRKLEMLFAFLILVMGSMFGYEYVMEKPDQVEVLKGMFIPGCSQCDNESLLQAVGIVGAVIMPHNLYLHSGLVKSREINRKHRNDIRKANMYFLIESAMSLLISFIINVFVMAVFASSLHGVTNSEALSLCESKNVTIFIDAFPVNDALIDVDIYKGGVYLGCKFGIAATFIWAIGILAAGQSSTMTGTYAGQYVMEGFLNLNWARWKRILFTRSVAIFPTFLLAKFSSISDLSSMNDILNAVMSIQLPFSVIPMLTLTSSYALMREFKNSKISIMFTCLVSIAVIAINVYFFVGFIGTNLKHLWYIILLLVIYGAFYMSFIIYLGLCFLQALEYPVFEKLTLIPKCLIPSFDDSSITEEEKSGRY